MIQLIILLENQGRVLINPSESRVIELELRCIIESIGLLPQFLQALNPIY